MLVLALKLNFENGVAVVAVVVMMQGGFKLSLCLTSKLSVCLGLPLSVLQEGPCEFTVHFRLTE